MKKILIISEVFYPENSLVNDFALELIDKGYEVGVLTQHPSYPYGRIFPGYENVPYMTDCWKGITIYRFNFIEGYRESKVKKILNYWTFVRRGIQIAKRIGDKYDSILVYQTGPLTLALPGVYIKNIFRKHLTVWTFDIWPDAVYAYGFPRIFPLTYFLRWILRKVYGGADQIVVSSKMFVEAVTPYALGKDIMYAPNWLVEEEEKATSLWLDKTKLNFMFTGNISISQNLINVLKGWKLANLKDACLHIVGDGSYANNVKDCIEQEKISDVICHGRIPSNEIMDTLQKSDILILSLVKNSGISKTEPFKLQAYLKAGKPIFGIIDGAGKAIIEENQIGICANPENVADIASKFIEAVTFAWNNDVTDKAVGLLRSRFNRKTTIQRVIEIL